MKTILDKSTREELINRINTLDENSTAQWGEMNIKQMLRHCIIWEEMALGKRTLKRSFLGHIFGKMALKDFIKDDSPQKRNLPASPEMRVKENVNTNVASEKKKWIDLLEVHSQPSTLGFVHPFFGKVTKEESGYLAYKHTDHHLRQFGA